MQISTQKLMDAGTHTQHIHSSKIKADVHRVLFRPESRKNDTKALVIRVTTAVGCHRLLMLLSFRGASAHSPKLVFAISHVVSKRNTSTHTYSTGSMSS